MNKNSSGSPDKGSQPLVPTQEEISELSRIFTEDRMRFISQMPFYGILLMELEPIGTGIEIPTAAVNYKNLYLHAIAKKRHSAADQKSVIPYSELSLTARASVLAHEILHVVFEHLSISPDFDRNISNIAMDAVINRILMDDPSTFNLDEVCTGYVRPYKDKNSGNWDGFTVGDGPEKKTFKIPDFAKLDWIPIYWHIMEQLEKECKCSGGGTPEEQRKETARRIKEAAEKLGEMNPMNGDAAQGDESEESPETQQARARWRQRVVSAVEEAKKRGTCPGEIERYIDNLESGKVPWTNYLRRLIQTEIARDDFRYAAVSRKAHLSYGGKRRPPIFPKVESDALGHVYLALDTSGSMGDADIREGLSEFKSLRQTVPFILHFCSCDATAYEIVEYDQYTEPDWSSMPIYGGGGTDFKPVFDLIAEDMKKGVKPALLVYFTDGYGSFPKDPPPYPVIWVVNCSNDNFPFGQVVHVD